MIYKGVISSVSSDTKKARVYIQEIDYLSTEIQISNQITEVQPNDNVVVAFTGKALADGIIIENTSRVPLYEGGGSTSTYSHNQIVPSSVWTIKHNLAKYPSVTITDSAGSVVEGDINYVTDNEIQVSFTAAFAGTVYLN